MRIAASMALIGALLLVSGAAAKLCQFGYADAVVVGDSTTLGWVGAENAGVPQDSGRIIPLDGQSTGIQAHARDIRSHIQAMNASGIRPLVDLTEVIFKHDPLVNSACHFAYERGNLRNTSAWPRQDFKPNYEAMLDIFLALNSSELGTDSIRGFIIHIEANNNCVPPWRIDAPAAALKARGYGPAQGYILSAGYGLTNTNEPGFQMVSVGMPTGLFPSELTHITPWAYDIHSLFVSSVYNLNQDVKQLGVAGFWNKFVGKLGSHQQVIWGMTALCGPHQQLMFNGPHLAPEQRLGTQCTTSPLQWTWPLAWVANDFRPFAEQQPRMDGLMAIYWTGPNGTNVLDAPVTSAHIKIGNSALTCESGALDFYTLAPCRVVDTRPDSAVQSGLPRTFLVGSQCGVPLSAQAVAANVTVLQSSGSGFLTLFPAGQAVPPTSTISFAPVQERSNSTLLALGAGAMLSAQSSVEGGGGVHLIIDVTGYFE